MKEDKKIYGKGLEPQELTSYWNISIKITVGKI